MAEKFGVTDSGFLQKRLDTLINSLHDSLSADWGFNTRNNPESFLNVLLTDFADKLAELWELGVEIYNSRYPFSATGISLDNAIQFGGTTREAAAQTIYSILCSGKNETFIPKTTRISSETSPEVILMPATEGRISLLQCERFSFNTVGRIVSGERYTLTIDEIGFSYVSQENDSSSDILHRLKDELENTPNDVFKQAWLSENQLTTTFDDEGNLCISSADGNSHSVTLSSNLTSKSVSSVLQFATVEYGEIILPPGAISRIVNGVDGLETVINTGNYISGRNKETDEECRLSYAKKIFIRSRTMCESIESAILENVQSVKTCKAYENPSNIYKKHMPPHSVEVVVDCSNDDDINVAKQILATKAAGIQSSHCCGLNKNEPLVTDVIDTRNYAAYAREFELPGTDGEPILVRFSKPCPMLIGVDVTIYRNNEPMAVNCYELIETEILSAIDSLNPGESVLPQKWLSGLYKKVSGIAHFEIKVKKEGEELQNCITSIPYNFKAFCPADSITITVATG